MAYEAILYEKRERVAVLTLNKPERLNAIGAAIRSEVHAAVGEAHKDDEVRALIITGAGRGFCSGADLTTAAIGANPPPLPKDQNSLLDDMGWVGRWAHLFHDFDKPLSTASRRGRG